MCVNKIKCDVLFQGNATNPSVPLVIFGILSIISALIVLKMPETNNQPIPESLDQAENFGL